MSKRFTLVLWLTSVMAVGAQSFSLRGKILDQTGALIPGVSMPIRHPESGAEWKTVSSGDGSFVLAGLPGGAIEIVAELAGFRTSRQTLRLSQKSVVDISITLDVGAVAESVEVTAGRPALMSTSSQMQLPGGGPDPAARRRRPMNTETYSNIEENPFRRVSDDPRSTFAIDVDTASYANVRRFLNQKELPPRDAVRIEELVNYFSYRYDPPAGVDPIAIHTEVTAPFWAPRHRLVRIALRSKDVDLSTRQRANLVFLIDVSGSMMDPMKLPLVKRSLHLLVEQLHDDDQIAMAVYAGSSGLVLPSTPGSDRDRIRNAIDRLEAGGSTNGGAGIQLAYSTAVQNYIPGGINRVILATDGDFNVGVTSEGELVRLIQEKAASGVFLTVLGYGMGNYNDSTLEKLADKGHGNYAYIDTVAEAKRVLVERITGTLMTVAKDVKLQIEFNPATVAAYRLIGYENRLLDHADFDNDAKQGGDIGAGLTVTALYEVVPAGVATEIPGARPLKYQQPPKRRSSRKDELLTVSLRYKAPEGNRSSLMSVPIRDTGAPWERASNDLRFAAAVASFGMVLRESPSKGSATFDTVIDAAEQTLQADASEYRKEFVELARKARALKAGL
jgi:Ca-activated chloride channel homolog